MVATVRGRRGASATGCLFSLLLVVALLYYGIDLGRVWWRYVEITDRMKTVARFSHRMSDAEVLAQLRSDAAELGLPDEAGRFRVRRTRVPPEIRISTEYHETVELPFHRRTFVFRPDVTFRR
jgi:hypothetical protein